MKNLSRAACFAALFLASCTTVGTLDVMRVAAITQEAAQIGTSEALRDNPNWMPIFVTVRDQLNSLAAQDKITVAGLLGVVSRLPVRELSSDTARLSFEAARLVISVTGWADIEVVQTAQLRPIALALANGITSGLPAPMPLQRSMRHHYKAK